MATPLTPPQLLQGIFSTIYVSISIVIGIIIISKYFKYKSFTFLWIGIAWTGMAVPWSGDVINFFAYLTGAPYLTDEMYLIIVIAFLPLFVFLWLVALSDLLSFKRKNLVLLITLILSIAFEIAFFTVMFTGNTASIGYSVSPFQYQFGDLIAIYMLIIIIIVLATGLKFALESFKADDKTIKLKGKLLIIAFISFTTGAMLDSVAPMILGEMTEVMIVIVRMILISSSIIFYLGFILPDWAKKILIKKK